MKKLLSFLLVAVMVFAFCGCTKNVEDQKITLNLPYGDREGTYTGEMSKDLPNGQGVFVTKNSEGEEWSYEGAFVNGTFEGEGKQTWTDTKQVNEGTFKNGEFVEGSFTNPDGKLVYKGTFKNEDAHDRYNGNGAFYHNDEITYEGEFSHGVPTDKSGYKKATKVLKYNNAAKDPDKYFNKPVYILGEIVQVMEGEDGYVEYRVDVDPDSYDESKVFYVTYTRPEGESRLIEGEYVTVWGQYDGLFTYETTAGSNLTVPSILGMFIEKQ